MLESIIQFINLKLSLLNYFEKRHCLTTLVKNDDGLIYPAEYITNGDFDAIDFDAYDGVSYMRVNGEVDIARTDQQYTPKPRVEVSFPLKLVYAVRKDKLTQDDAYSWDRVRASIAKQLETDSKDLANTLDADLVQISTSSYMSDTKEIWDEETAETGQFQPKFEVVFGSMEVTVTVTTRVECIPAECDDFESDILKSFDFCSTTIQGRLTPEQITCLTDWLCGSGDPVTIQINGVTYTTAEAGSTFDQQIVNTDDDAVGTAANPSVVGDSTIQINGVDAGFAIAERTYNQEVVNTDADAVGTAANPSVIGDSTITINGASLGATGDVVAEGSLNIEVNLDGNPSGSWDGDSWEVTSAPCADATVNINTIFMDNVASGDTLDLEVRQETGATLVGSKQGQYWRIDDSTITINSASLGATGDVAAEDSLNITVNLDGSPSGSWSGTSWDVISTPCADVTVNANGVLVDNVASGGTLDIDVHDTLDNNVGTVVSTTEIEIADSTIQNNATPTWTDTIEAEGTLTLAQAKALDSDGVTDLLADYIPSASGYMFTCTLASYGTRILSILQREYSADALCGFSFRYIDDKWADANEAVIRVRRSSDNTEQDFTPTEITDGTLTTFTGANDGHVVKFYDQTGNYFNMYNSTAGNQAKLVTAGTLNVDSQGNPTAITTSTQGYFIGANGSNASQMTLFSPSGAFWIVGKKANSTTISRAYTAAGNPAIGIADTTTFTNANGTGTPIGYVNGAALANNQRTTLQSAINDVEHILFMEDAQWTASGTWRTNTTTAAFQNYQVGTQISEFVLSKKDWSDSALRADILNDTNNYYTYYP